MLVIIDRGHAALELRDTSIVPEIHMMRANRSQMGVREAHVPTPHAVRHLMTVVTVALATRDLLLPGGGGRGRRRSRVELCDRVTMVQLRVASNVVVARVALTSGILYGQHIEIRAAVVFGMATAAAGGTISFGCGWPGVLEAVRLFQLLGRLEHEIDAIGTFVIYATAAYRFREVHDHSPWHSGQVAQVTLCPFAHHLADGERGDWLDLKVC